MIESKLWVDDTDAFKKYVRIPLLNLLNSNIASIM